MRYHMKDTHVFYKQKNETIDLFLTRVFNYLITFNRLIEETRTHIDFNDNTLDSNWIAVDYTNLSDE